MKINDLDIKCIIFDLDGTLLNSTLVWKEVDENFFLKRGMKVPLGYGKKIAAMGLTTAASYTKNTYNIKESEEEIIKEWLDAVQEKYEHEVTLKTHVKEYLDYLKGFNIPLCVATANSKECYEPCLINNGIYHYFDHIVDVKKYKEGKTSPAIFLDIAKKQNLDPKDILVFEDTLSVIKICKNASFNVVAVYDEGCLKEDEKEKEQLSDIYINDFKTLIN